MLGWLLGSWCRVNWRSKSSEGHSVMKIMTEMGLNCHPCKFQKTHSGKNGIQNHLQCINVSLSSQELWWPVVWECCCSSSCIESDNAWCSPWCLATDAKLAPVMGLRHWLVILPQLRYQVLHLSDVFLYFSFLLFFFFFFFASFAEKEISKQRPRI